MSHKFSCGTYSQCGRVGLAAALPNATINALKEQNLSDLEPKDVTAIDPHVASAGINAGHPKEIGVGPGLDVLQNPDPEPAGEAGLIPIAALPLPEAPIGQTPPAVRAWFDAIAVAIRPETTAASRPLMIPHAPIAAAPRPTIPAPPTAPRCAPGAPGATSTMSPPCPPAAATSPLSSPRSATAAKPAIP